MLFSSMVLKNEMDLALSITANIKISLFRKKLQKMKVSIYYPDVLSLNRTGKPRSSRNCPT